LVVAGAPILPASELGGGLGAGVVDGGTREGAAGALGLVVFELSALHPTVNSPPMARIERSVFTVAHLSWIMYAWTEILRLHPPLIKVRCKHERDIPGKITLRPLFRVVQLSRIPDRLLAHSERDVIIARRASSKLGNGSRGSSCFRSEDSSERSRGRGSLESMLSRVVPMRIDGSRRRTRARRRPISRRLSLSGPPTWIVP
jgi:hypothetical protein